MQREELGGWLRLTLTSGVGNETGRKLLGAFGLPDNVFCQSALALRQVVPVAQSLSLQTQPTGLASLLDLTWNWLEQSGAGSARRRIVVLGDADYPPALLTIEDPPLMLYLLGDGTLGTSTLLAVVGSRNPTPQGSANARNFSRTLAMSGLTIVSGLALGVDAAAHEGALDSVEAGSTRLTTVAVVGTGVDRVYPKAHLDLARRIAHNGLLISEYPLGTPPLTANFPKRNRLIAGLAQGTLVVEAALRSGSLITARLTADQGKDVFAIPGSIHSPLARGCHALIKQGAKLVETAQDVLEEMKIVAAPATAGNPPASALFSETVGESHDPLTELLDSLGFDPVGLDALQARNNLDTADLQAQLMTLELEGLVARLPGGLFQRITPTPAR
jgi:DNA processing protein